MTSHSSVLALRIPVTEETGRLQSMGLQRAGHGWVSEYTHTHTHIYTHKWAYDKFCVNFKFLQLQNNHYVQWLSLESSDFFRNFWTSLIIRSILSKGIVTSFVCLIPLCRKDNSSTIKEMKPQDFLQLFCSLQS